MRSQPGLSTLVLAEALPFPTFKGGDVRTWQNLNALAKVGPTGIFGLCSNDQRRHALPALDLSCWSASTDPALASPPPRDMNLAGRAWLLDPAGHPSDLHYSDHAAGELSVLLERLRPDVVVIEGLWLCKYLPILTGAGCRTVLDCHAIEAALLRELALTNDRQDLEGRVLRDVLPARTAMLEQTAVRAVDQLWVCSGADEQRLRALYEPTAPVAVVPNGVRLDAYDLAGEPGACPAFTVLFPGIFSYLPNGFAAAFLVEQIFPRLAAVCDDVRLVMVGAHPTPELLAASMRDPRIVVTGAVPDVRPYLHAATAMAVPVFQGGGTRIKVLEAFAAGLPVVSSPKGVEGLNAQGGVHFLPADNADEFAEGLLRLRAESALARRLAVAARALVAEAFSWDLIGRRVRGAISALKG